MRRVLFLIWKELIELQQDPRLFGVVIVAPILQLVMLGYAATTDIRNVPLVVADADRSNASRDLIERFRASRNFTVVDIVRGVDEIDPFLEKGRAWMALDIPAGYGDGLAAGRPQTLQVVADGSDANSTNIGLGYATNLIALYSQELAARSTASVSARIEPRVRVWFNPQLESRDFMIPGILALLLLVVTTNLSSMGIVGKLVPYGLVGLIDVLLVLAVAIGWFHVPLRGSFWLLMSLTLVYLLTTLGL